MAHAAHATGLIIAVHIETHRKKEPLLKTELVHVIMLPCPYTKGIPPAETRGNSVGSWTSAAAVLRKALPCVDAQKLFYPHSDIGLHRRPHAHA